MKKINFITLILIVCGLASCSLLPQRFVSPPYYEKPMYRDVKEWKSVGKTRDGTAVYIAAKTISYPNGNLVRLLAKTQIKDREFIDLLEFDCPHYKFRILENTSSKKPRWRGISSETPSKLIHNAICQKKKIKTNN
jgi:hypothetical protein